MSDVIVIDDAISKEYQDHLENLALDSYTPWYFQKYANYPANESIERGIKDTFQFTHNILNNGEYSRYYSEITPVISAIPFTINKIIRVKLNMTFKSYADEHQYDTPAHVDFPDLQNYQTAIYYVNDSDGDTIIFNETDINTLQESLTIKQIISPKKGRLIVFDGNILHKGNNPTMDNHPRVVMNLNFIKYR